MESRSGYSTLWLMDCIVLGLTAPIASAMTDSALSGVIPASALHGIAQQSLRLLLGIPGQCKSGELAGTEKRSEQRATLMFQAAQSPHHQPWRLYLWHDPMVQVLFTFYFSFVISKENTSQSLNWEAILFAYTFVEYTVNWDIHLLSHTVP